MERTTSSFRLKKESGKAMLQQALAVEKEDQEVGSEIHDMVSSAQQEEEVHNEEDLAHMKEAYPGTSTSAHIKVRMHQTNGLVKVPMHRAPDLMELEKNPVFGISMNGWVVASVVSAVAGVALLSFSAKMKVQTNRLAHMLGDEYGEVSPLLEMC